MFYVKYFPVLNVLIASVSIFLLSVCRKVFESRGLSSSIFKLLHLALDKCKNQKYVIKCNRGNRRNKW